jgi:hypothetical protein
MTSAYETGIMDVLEKIAKSIFSRKSLSEFIAEGGNITKSMVGKGAKISPYELTRAQSTAKKLKRRKMFQEATEARGLKSQKEQIQSMFKSKAGAVPAPVKSPALEKLKKIPLEERTTQLRKNIISQSKMPQMKPKIVQPSQPIQTMPDLTRQTSMTRRFQPDNTGARLRSVFK